MAATVSGADWLRKAGTQKVMDVLLAARPGGARFVGGCVRNALLGAPVSDIDIATQLHPEDVIAALKEAGIRVVPTGIEHGTVTAICDREPFEITTLRRDVETDGRRAVVAFTEDWAEDAQRRDFRMNALYADRDGVIYDPTGGLQDVAERRIVFIGEAEQRLREDHLRNLRFFRFTAWYAKAIDAEGLRACEVLRDDLKQIAAERIWKELIKLLDAPNPFPSMNAMADTGILGVILPESDTMARGTSLLHQELRTGVRADAMQRLMSLLPRNEDTAERVSALMKVSRAERERLKFWAKAPSPAAAYSDEAALKQWLYGLSPETRADVVRWDMAERGLADGVHDEALELALSWQSPVFPLQGSDLVKAGLKPGPELGDTLKRLEALWVENGFSFNGVVDPALRDLGY